MNKSIFSVGTMSRGGGAQAVLGQHLVCSGLRHTSCRTTALLLRFTAGPGLSLAKAQDGDTQTLHTGCNRQQPTSSV